MPVTVSKVLTKVFGSRNERLLKRYRAIVSEVNDWEPKISEMTDPELRARTQELREGLAAGKLRSVDVLPEAFAIIRESMDRHIGIRSIFNPDEHFDPDQLDDEMLQAYDDVQRVMITTGVSWQNINIPPKIYKAIRKLYPESRPPFRTRCFDVQIIGGLVLYEGKIPIGIGEAAWDTRCSSHIYGERCTKAMKRLLKEIEESGQNRSQLLGETTVAYSIMVADQS